MRKTVLLAIFLLVISSVSGLPSVLYGTITKSGEAVVLPVNNTFTDNVGDHHVVTITPVDGPDGSNVMITIEKGVSEKRPGAPVSFVPRLPGRGYAFAGRESNTIYGQLTDEYGTPLGGETVIVELTDENDVTVELETTTITKEEAIERGNASLEGYYFLDFGELQLGKNLSVVVRSGSMNRAVSESDVPEQNETVNVEVGKGIEFTFLFENPLVAFFKNNWKTVFLVLLFSGIFLTGVYLFQHRTQSASSLASRLHRFQNNKISGMMNEHPFIVPEETTVRALLSRFVTQRYALVTHKEELAGIVSDRDMLKTDYTAQSADSLHVKDIMSPAEETLLPSTPMTEAIKIALQTEHGVLPVVKRSKPEGVVLFHDIMVAFDKFFSVNQFVLSNLPRVKACMSEYIGVQEQTPVKDALEMMKGTSILLVTKTRKSGKKQVEDLKGVLTYHELCDELYNYEAQLATRKVDAVMGRKFKSINPGASIIEANKVMIEHEIQALPVLLGDEVAGVLTQRNVVEALEDLFSQLLQKKDIAEEEK